jgi:hypothetical protein
MPTKSNLIPIFTSHGDVAAYLAYPYLYSSEGEWIGWVSTENKVFSVHGHFVGLLSNEPRILRKREWDYQEPRRTPPEPPPSIRPPARVPLAPMMPEVTLNVIDVLEEAPELLPSSDFGELRDDLD